MAEVVVELRILPKDMDVNLEKLEQDIISAIAPQKLSREPIAFGLVALNLTKLVKDEAGQVEELEKRLRAIEGVGEVEVVRVSRAIF